MKPLGARKTRTRIEGHQECAVCHPQLKGGRAAEHAMWRKREAMDVENGKWGGATDVDLDGLHTEMRKAQEKLMGELDDVSSVVTLLEMVILAAAKGGQPK